MKTILAIAIATMLVAAFSRITVFPRCQPGDPGTYMSGALMSGCQSRNDPSFNRSTFNR
jgi:hypothetical protein